MYNNDLHHQTIAQLIRGINRKEFSAFELTQHYLERIEKFDKQLNSFITITADEALTTAKNIDQKLAKIKPRSQKFPALNDLAGIPLAYKDNFCTRDIRTSCGSKMLDNFIAPYNATVVERLRKSNCIMLGKTNMDEFAMGSSNENSYYGAVKNPWNLDKVPGGSSGGSAAAVAARLMPCALGTDTGGSARQPASFCGITGLKPTYGLISRYGIISFASSLDQAGILAPTAADIALVLAAVAGYDSNDSTSCPAPLPNNDYNIYVKNLDLPLHGLKIGLSQECFNESLNQDIATAIDHAIKDLEKLGAQIKPIALPHFNLAMLAYYAIAPAEASSNLARYDGIRYGYRSQSNSIKNIDDLYACSRSEGFGDEVKRRIILGTYVLSSGCKKYYVKAQQVRQLIKNDFVAAFKEVDVILTPTTPTTAFDLRNKNTQPPTFKESFADMYTTPANLAGLPGLSLPIGFIHSLPVGMQLIGNYFCEAQLLNAANQYQRTTNWHQQIPPLFL